MQKSRRIWWLCGWFPGSSMPFAGNFVWRHAKAVKGNMPETDLVLLHFPLFYWGEMPPAPVGDEFGDWQMDTRFSLNFGYTWKGDEGGKSKQSGGELLLYYRPVLQFGHPLLRPLNFLMYCLVVAYRLLRMNSILGKPALVHLHVADKIGLPFNWLKRFVWRDVKAYYTEHWAIFGTAVQDRYEQRNPIFKYYLKRVWENIDWAAGISIFTHQWMQKTFHQAKPLIAFPNVVNEQIFNIHGCDFNQSTNTFLHVSNFESRKRVVEIIAAFQEFTKTSNQNWVLKLAGGLQSQLENQNHLNVDLNANNIMWLGKLTAVEVAAEMKAATAFILYSESENAPCVISEALCCGLPVVSNAIAAIPEMINNGENGVLVDDSVGGLMKGITEVLHLTNPAIRNRISTDANKKYGSQFVTAALIKSYSENLKGGVR